MAPAAKPGGKGLSGRRPAILGIAIVLLLLSRAAPVSADAVNGHVDLIYSTSDTIATDQTGTTTKTESRAMIQQYSLSLEKNLWPNLRLYGSGIFQRTDADSVSNGERSSSTTVMTRPFVDVSLATPLYSIGGNYGKVTTEQTSSGTKSVLISETTTGYLSWKPADLPTLDVRATETRNYDKDRVLYNTVNDLLSVNSTYRPASSVQLRYYGNYGDNRDRLGGTETITVGHDGKVDYTDRFFKDRVTFSASEEYAVSEVEVRSTFGEGTVSFQEFASKGLALNTYDLEGLSRIPLSDASYLIDSSYSGNRTDSNNIGSGLYPTDQTPRNLGLQFSVPTEVNALDIWVYSVRDTRLLDTSQDYLTTAVAASFTWAVYISSDGISWTLYQSAVSGTYSSYAAQLGVGTFEITFPNVTTQFIKVVVTPLQPSAAGNTGKDFPGVYVNELQAFNTMSTQSGQEKRRSTTRTTNVAAKVSLLENPHLFYDFSYYEVQSEAFSSTSRNSTMSNGLSFNQQFNRVFSGTASAQRIDTKSSAEGSDSVVYQMYAVVQAVPLRTLSHSLSVSDQTRETETGRSTSQSYYLTNNAELYKDVTVYLNGGQTWDTDEYHVRRQSLQYSYGGSVTPVKTLIISGGSVYSRSEGYFSRTDNLTAAYKPVPALYLTSGWSVVADSNRTNRLQNYGATWSPFPGGALIVGVTYSETLQTQDNSITQSLSESIRWNVNRRTAIQASYGDSTSKSDLSRTTTRSFFAELTTSL